MVKILFKGVQNMIICNFTSEFSSSESVYESGLYYDEKPDYSLPEKKLRRIFFTYQLFLITGKMRGLQ